MVPIVAVPIHTLCKGVHSSFFSYQQGFPFIFDNSQRNRYEVNLTFSFAFPYLSQCRTFFHILVDLRFLGKNVYFQVIGHS